MKYVVLSHKVWVNVYGYIQTDRQPGGFKKSFVIDVYNEDIGVF